MANLYEYNALLVQHNIIIFLLVLNLSQTKIYDITII